MVSLAGWGTQATRRRRGDSDRRTRRRCLAVMERTLSVGMSRRGAGEAGGRRGWPGPATQPGIPHGSLVHTAPSGHAFALAARPSVPWRRVAFSVRRYSGASKPADSTQRRIAVATAPPGAFDDQALGRPVRLRADDSIEPANGRLKAPLEADAMETSNGQHEAGHRSLPHSAQHDSLVTSLRNAWAPILSASLIVG